MLLVPLLPSDQPSASPERPSRREQQYRTVSPSGNLSQKGPFDAYCTPLDTGDHRPGCPYRMTSYAGTDTGVWHSVAPPPVPRVHWGSGVGSLAEPVPGLLGPDNGSGRRCAGLMTSNLQVLGQFVTSLNCMSSEVLLLAIGPEVFPSAAVDVLSPVPRAPRGARAANYMSAMGLWRPPGSPGDPGPLPASSCNSCMNCTNCFPDLTSSTKP